MTESKALAANDSSQSCELCIIGAGAAGLNALFVAAGYLKKTDRVILIDRRDRPGGMWNDVYDYARLHQPHPSFTVGDMKWNWSRPSNYLATGAEVAAHLQRCYAETRKKIDLVELFEHSVTSCNEITIGGNGSARLECRDRDGRTHTIDAKRVIKAIGFDVPAAKPMAFSSKAVISTTPELLSEEVGFESRAPVYVVGGGKTGMDTAYNLITKTVGRSVALINGRGTVFVKREEFFPAGVRRWWSGTLLANLIRNQALMFNGTNEFTCFEELRRTSTIAVGNRNELWFYGILSRQERDIIDLGLERIINDYLVDVIDGRHGPEMVFRSGVRRRAPQGSVFVNCTGHLLREKQAHDPYLSEGGAILAINQRSMVHFLSTASAYFMTHLFFRGALRDLPLYEVDGEALLAKSRRAYHTALMSVTFMNLIVMMRVLPLKVFNECGLDIDRLYPLHRRAVTMIDLKLNGRRHVRHCRSALDRVREIYGVRCGPLPAATDRNTAAPIQGDRAAAGKTAQAA